jgi:hypothetical protein
MNLKIYIIVALFIITLRATICNAQKPYCNGINYTTGSAFESNMATVFNTLVEDTFQTGFNTTVYGQSPDQIYGILQCRGDATVDQCKSCSQNATTVIRQSQNCGNAIGGSIWPFHCFLRYESYDFIGQLDTDLGSIYAEDFRGDTGIFIPTDFYSSAQNLLNKLSGEAAPKTTRSALGTALDSFSQTIYGLAQCTRDLSTDDCTQCLSYSINKIFKSYPGYAGVQYWSQSCIVRYEIYPFFNSTAL